MCVARLWRCVAFGVFAVGPLVEVAGGNAPERYDTKTVIPGFFNIVRSENPGVAFGMFPTIRRSRER